MCYCTLCILNKPSKLLSLLQQGSDFYCYFQEKRENGQSVNGSGSHLYRLACTTYIAISFAPIARQYVDLFPQRHMHPYTHKVQGGRERVREKLRKDSKLNLWTEIPETLKSESDETRVISNRLVPSRTHEPLNWSHFSGHADFPLFDSV